MPNYKFVMKLTTVACFALLLLTATGSTQSLPAEKAGTINAPTGQIAFIRNQHIYTMNADGSNQTVVCEAANADGGLAWSPDAKTIAFTRSGKVDLKGPDMLGGIHKVYDIFFAYPDSAKPNAEGKKNTLFWQRFTNDVGSRDPNWSYDGKTIIYWKDMNANYVNAGQPNYQICEMSPDGSDYKILRGDWQTAEDFFLIWPSLAPDGRIAAVAFFGTNPPKPQGMVVLNPDEIMLPYDSLRARALKNLNKVRPNWSPDGKWIAYIGNDMNTEGVYITTPDLSETYLVFKPPVSTNLRVDQPSFSPDSKYLTFATQDGSIWICDITGNNKVRLTGPGIDMTPTWTKPLVK